MSSTFSGRCIYVNAFGGPEVLVPGNVTVTAPQAGEAVIRYTVIGVNFADTYQRCGDIHNDELKPPFIPGLHGVGVVVALGAGVSGIAIGDRVTYVGGPGAYTEYRKLPANRLVRVPDELSDELLAAAYARGLTCQYLLKQLHKVQPGETILVHAAAGGVGQLLVQWAKHLGATVIGTVGTKAKAERVEALGCDHAIVYTEEDFVARVQEITKGAGVPVVYDSVGAATFHKSLACLASAGLAINYGTASGPVPPLSLQDLHSKSLSVCRPTMRNWIATREALEAASADVFEMLTLGALSIKVDQVLELEQAAHAHTLLEGRAVEGAIVLRT